jgi:hypothetical protein
MISASFIKSRSSPVVSGAMPWVGKSVTVTELKPRCAASHKSFSLNSASFIKCRSSPVFSGALPGIGTESRTMLASLP